MKTAIQCLVTLTLLIVTAQRLPAPIQEMRENPTPKPRSVKAAPKKPVQPKPSQSPTPQSKATPSAQPISASDQTAITTALTDLEKKWEAAVAAHEVSAVEAFVADDYVSVSSAGQVLNKTQLLDQLQKDGNIYESAAIEDVNVRVVRPDFAIVTGLTREKGKTKEGKAFNRSFRFTDTWTKGAGGWRCTNAQVVKVSDK